MTSALAAYSEEQVRVFRESLLGEKATDAQLLHFAQVAQHLDLDPAAGELAGIIYGGRLSTTVTVEGLLTLAERAGVHAGHDGPYWCGVDAQWREVWLEGTRPAAAKAVVYRTDRLRPSVGVALMAEAYQKQSPLWSSMPVHMLGTAAMRIALRRAGHRELAREGISTRELSLPSRISMEARQVGLGDEGRHALVAEVTGGRTESTRELTPGEALAVRERLAEMTPQEVEARAKQWADEDMLAKVMPSLRAMEGDTLKAFRAWLTERQLPQEAVKWTRVHLAIVAQHLEDAGLWVEAEDD